MKPDTVALITKLLPYADIQGGVVRSHDKGKIQSPQILLKQLLDGGILLFEPNVVVTENECTIEVVVLHSVLRWEYKGEAKDLDSLYDNIKLHRMMYPTGRFVGRKFIAVGEEGIYVSKNFGDTVKDASIIRPMQMINKNKTRNNVEQLEGFELVSSFR